MLLILLEWLRGNSRLHIFTRAVIVIFGLAAFRIKAFATNESEVGLQLAQVYLRNF